jgi:hypothetical protein
MCIIQTTTLCGDEIAINTGASARLIEIKIGAIGLFGRQMRPTASQFFELRQSGRNSVGSPLYTLTSIQQAEQTQPVGADIRWARAMQGASYVQGKTISRKSGRKCRITKTYQ